MGVSTSTSSRSLLLWKGGWICVIAFMYLEWYLAKQMSRCDLSREEKAWWEHQRTYGLCQAVRSASEQNELKYIADRLETPGGNTNAQTTDPKQLSQGVSGCGVIPFQKY